MTTKAEIHARHAALLTAMRSFEANPNHPGTIAWNDLSTALIAYESTGDHDHGRALQPGAPCPGNDCVVHRARRALLRALLSTLAL